MKIKELIKELGKLDQGKEVYVSSDAEGNSLNPLAETSDGWFFKDGEPCDGDVRGAKAGVVLFPV